MSDTVEKLTPDRPNRGNIFRGYAAAPALQSVMGATARKGDIAMADSTMIAIIGGALVTAMSGALNWIRMRQDRLEAELTAETGARTTAFDRLREQMHTDAMNAAAHRTDIAEKLGNCATSADVLAGFNRIQTSFDSISGRINRITGTGD